MPTVASRAWRALAAMLVAAALLLFVSSGDLAYREAWWLIVCYFAPMATMTHWLLRSEPALLARRLEAGVGAEKRQAQKVIIALAAIAVAALLVLPGIEHRSGHAPLSLHCNVVGNALVIVGTVIIAAVCRANPYSSASIRVEKLQPLVTDGPYAHVRHPMYAGMCVHLLGVPIALGYLSAYVPAGALVGLLVLRLLDEERELVDELPGYVEYMNKVRYRLVPLVW